MSDNLFIVISGHNPQSGKRERISKVRAHIRKRHFLKLRNEAGIQKRQQSLLQSAATQKYAGRITIPKELPNLIPAGHALLNPTIFEAETTRRMHKCKPPRSLCSAEMGNCLKEDSHLSVPHSGLIKLVLLLSCLASRTVFPSCTPRYIVLPDLWNGFRLVRCSRF